MLGLTQQGWELIPQTSRRTALFFLPLSFAGGVLELTGIASVLPFVVLATNPEIVRKNYYFQTAYQWLEFESVRSFLLFCGFAVLGAVIGREIFSLISNYYSAKMSSTIQKELSERLLEKYLHQDFDFFLRRHSAELGQNVLVRVGEYMGQWFYPMVSLVGAVISLAILAVGFFLVNPVVAVCALLFFGTGQLLIYRKLKPWLIDLGEKARLLDNQRFRTAADAIQGIREAKILNCEGFYLSLYVRQNTELLKLNLRRVLLQHWPQFLSNLTVYVVVVGAILVLSSLASGPRLISLMTVYLLLLVRIVPKIQFIFAAMSKLRGAQSIVEALHADLQSGGSANSIESVAAPPPMEKSFGFRGVSFCYGQDRSDAVQDVTFTIERGTTVAIVGSTGAGKTTLLDLMTGLLKPQSGEFLLDGKAIEPTVWRQHVGYASQEVFLVDHSLASNIAFGVDEEEIDLDAVEKAARLACLHDFVMDELPQGYQTTCGERGSSLSRGQKQRVGIARALYRDPTVIFLDEATSGLDLATESQVLVNLTTSRPPRTVLIVTHRLHTAARCDLVMLLEKGRLVGHGGFSELQEHCRELQELMTVARDPDHV
jgi:ATP-binding cassette, subfamily B, bacterial PglK